MIITNIKELRLASPAHALDSIDGLVGFIDNSEHDFLEDKLGTPLYNALCKWYDQNNAVRSSVADYQTGYWNRLLLMAQRCVAFDALGRAIGMQAISVNNAGINMSIADDYPKADDKAVTAYRDTCTKEAHAALNQMLRQLEQWCKEGVVSGSPTDAEANSSLFTLHSSLSSERSEIVTLWKQSRYYYLAAALLIPSCEVLQAYLNIYDSREKFIQMLPDLQFIQEEIIANSIGDDLLKIVIDFARDGKVPEPAAEGDENAEANSLQPSSSQLGQTSDNSSLFTLHSSLTEPTLARLLHRLRKVVVALLVGRTSVLKYTKEQKVLAHDDGVRMLQNVTDYIKRLVPPEPAPAPVPEASPSGSTHRPACRDAIAAKDAAACWTPPLL